MSKKYAFVSVMFENKDAYVYAEALRTLAHSILRHHPCEKLGVCYRFIILTNEQMSEKTERELLREPRMNLEVFRVRDDMVGS